MLYQGLDDSQWQIMGPVGVQVKLMRVIGDVKSRALLMAQFNTATNETIIQAVGSDGNSIVALHYLPRNYHVGLRHTMLQVYEGNSPEPINYWQHSG